MWRLFKVLWGCRHMLRGSWQIPGRILGRVPWGARGKTDKVFWESVEILGGAFLVDFLGECLGRSVKELGTSRQIFGGILAVIPGSSRATDPVICGQLMQSVWGDIVKILGETWGKCLLRSVSGILATSWVQSRLIASGILGKVVQNALWISARALESPLEVSQSPWGFSTSPLGIPPGMGLSSWGVLAKS